MANPNLLPGLPPFDLTRGGKLFQFNGSTNINQYAFYVQDTIKFGNLNVQAGLRVDFYHGIVSDSSAQPRIGFSYLCEANRNRAASLLLAHVRDALTTRT